MKITEKTDEDIFSIAKPMIDDVIKGSNAKDWTLFSKYQTDEELYDPDNRKNVEAQWQKSEFLTSLDPEWQLLTILRRGEVAILVWKQTSTKVEGEVLACYSIQQMGQEVKEVGFRVI
ncbi:hypothetical protein [Marinomonas posidonica]|uniref:SnoaL-like domain-containing protein n=1 Tax=Marinomonas posidonica (strain CECT 7376 / NCIMB 14433 / IVIA-Po-181) TaxID=491952 RepID=F6CV08_MARPP|nr:hypothetical protein [Marinomonas posidonica]AEF55334.1 hypothetical protein Mar181_2298 [Marinomonas posidonica IVIA-Po-181]